MDEIRPGVFHWKAFHEGIRTRVSSYFLAEPATLIDPMLPDDGVRWFDEHVAPERIVLTNRHHYRHSAAFSEAFACPVLCHEEGLHEFGPDQPVRGFAFGDELAPGVTAVEIGAICPEETALHIALGDGMIAFADALIRYEEMPRFVSDGLLGDDPEQVKAGLREAFERLLELDFGDLLFAHGDPLLDEGRQAIVALAGV
jgi:hypothetical protein